MEISPDGATPPPNDNNIGTLNKVLEEDDHNSVVFDELSEAHIVMSEEPENNVKKTNNDELSDAKEDFAESSRILLEDADNSDHEWAEWTNSEDIKQKPKFPLASVQSGGDLIPSLKVVVVRAYPVMYSVSGKDGKICFMSERAFAKFEMDKATKQEELREQLLPGLEAEVRTRFVKKEKGHLKIEAKNDLERARSKQIEALQQAVSEEITAKMKAALAPERGPSRVLKIRVLDVESFSTSDITTSGVITIWNAQEEVINNIKECQVYEIQSLKPATFHPGQEIRLGTTKTTRIIPVEEGCLQDEPFFKRKFSSIVQVLADDFKPPLNEFDTLGVVRKVEVFNEHTGQIVHLVEEDGNVLKVKFWSSIADWGLLDVLKIGNVVACLNLQWRLTSAENKLAFAQESSIFLTNPKVDHLLGGYQQISDAIEKIMEFIPEEIQSTIIPKALQVTEECIATGVHVPTRNLAKVTYLERFEEPSELSDSSMASPCKRRRPSKKFVTPRRATPKK